MLLSGALRRYSGRRLALFFIVVLLLGIPAGALRALCVGKACGSSSGATARTPFCSLPAELRSAIARGTREGRSGEVLVVTQGRRVAGSTEDPSIATPWPTVGAGAPRVPIVFSGRGIRSGVELSPDVGLDDVAPTLARAIGFHRPHPEVRSGEALPEALETSKVPSRLLVVIALKGVGSEEVATNPRAWPRLRAAMRSGASTTEGSTLSASGDPVASITTLGTGGVPAQHGITGTLVRDDEGDLTQAWGSDSPINVIATLGDDLDENLQNRALIALVGTHRGDRGLIGGRWYPGDRDLIEMLDPPARPADVAERVSGLLQKSPLGDDDVPDLLGVAMAGRPPQLDVALGDIVAAASRAAEGSATFAVAGTGSAAREDGDLAVASLQQRLERSIPGATPLIEAMQGGAVFVDQRALAREKTSDDVILGSLLRMKNPEGSRLFADVFPTIAVTLRRFC